MPLGAQLPVRLEPDIESRLEAIAQRTGTTKSALIRMLAKRFVESCISEGGYVTLPANIQAMLHDRDARSIAGWPRAAKPIGPVKYRIPRKRK